MVRLRFRHLSLSAAWRTTSSRDVRVGGAVTENKQTICKTLLALHRQPPARAEHEPAKHVALVDALAVALKARGVDDLSAVLAARTGVAAFVRATICWLEDPGLELEKAARRSALRFEDAVV